MDEIHKKNIEDLKEMLKTTSIKDFWMSGFKDYNYLERTKKNYFSLYTVDFSYILYNTFNYQEKIF